MKMIRIEIGQVYELESGEEYEIVDLTEAVVKLKTSDGQSILRYFEEVGTSIEEGDLTLKEDVP